MRGSQKQFPVGLYYYIGKIDISVEYDLEEVLEHVTQTGTYGPWDAEINSYAHS